MRPSRKAWLLLASVGAILAAAALMIPPVRAYLLFQQAGAHPGTLDYYAEEAQAQGLSQYHFPSGMHEYYVSRTWDDVLTRYAFVVAEPVESRSYPTTGVGGDGSIASWHRFRIIETLSSKPLPFALGPPPSELTPVPPDQLLLHRWCGSLTRNGVELVADEPNFPAYAIGQRYLLILYLDPVSRKGSVQMGSQGVYLINSSGIISSVDTVGSIFEDDLSSRYGNSIDQLRAALNGSPTPTPTPPCNPSLAVLSACQSNGGEWDPQSCSCIH